jgi:hypothetical protein
LVCYLAGISNLEVLEKGPMSGALFENHVICETMKITLHNDFNREIYYFRSNHGIEADLIVIDKDRNSIDFIEIKNNQTARYKMIESIKKLIEEEKASAGISKSAVKGKLIYRGEKSETFSDDITCQNYIDWLTDYEQS